MNPDTDPLLILLAPLQLTALRDQLDTLLDEAARREFNLREALTFLRQAEVARREQRRWTWPLAWPSSPSPAP